MGIIGAYHDIPERFAEELPTLQERASLLGIAGTDLEWCWINVTNIRWEQDELPPGDSFRCPCCGQIVELARQDDPDDKLDFFYFIGLCGGCGVVWWY